MTNPVLLAALKDLLPWPWLQIPALIVLIALIIGYVMYRKRQL